MTRLGARDTTLRNGVMSENFALLCTNCTAMTMDLSNVSELLRRGFIDTECYNIEANHDKVQ